ncbi:MAG: gfo/Idh/MocA family oxidoreductase [Moraxellaceae bacterium]|jgi:predicted dehydrogenase|nr:gfo/Idh/MocA family oxidoreductase [Moraxellaceae bacterium]
MILLVGAGPMAVHYAKVLQGMQRPFVAVGRGEGSAEAFAAATGVPAIAGGLDGYLGSNRSPIREAIVAVGVEALAKVACRLIEQGVTRLLVEKPGGLTLDQIENLAATAARHGASVFIAYNRRCFASVMKARELIAEDGGVTSFNFEITEWGHVITPIIKPDGVKENWFLGNTSHVTDLAFYLGGRPRKLQSFVAGALPWHSRAARFSGAGETEAGALFSYSGDWEAPGRWGVEVMTARRRFIFRPLEELRVQLLGSVKVDILDTASDLDRDYKPGLYLQVQQFLAGGGPELCTLDDHLLNCRHYVRIAGYA